MTATTNLPTTPLISDLIGNYQGSTRRISLTALAALLGDGSGTGAPAAIAALQAAMDAADALLRSHGGKLFGSRQMAVDFGQANLFPSYSRMLTIEDDLVAIRGPNINDNDPLFGTSPYWGVIDRIPTIFALRRTGIIGLETTDSTGNFHVAQIDSALRSYRTSALTNGMLLSFQPQTANTGPASLTVSGVQAASPILNSDGAVLSGGELQPYRPYILQWRAPISSFRIVAGDVTPAALAAMRNELWAALDEVGDSIARLSDVIIDNGNGQALLGLDPAGNPTAHVFREPNGLLGRQPTVPVTVEAGGNTVMRSSARGVLTRLAPESLDDTDLRARFDGPWVIQSVGWQDGEAIASALWMGQTIPLALSPGGFPYVRNAGRVRVIFGLGQSQQGLGVTGSWAKHSLAPAHSFLLDTSFARMRGAQSSGFGSFDGQSFGAFTATGLLPVRNVAEQQSLIDALASRLALEQCAATGRADLYVTINVAAGGASIAQCGPNPPAGETIWANTLRALEEVARLASVIDLPVEVFAADFRQGYADRVALSTAAYLTALTGYEEAFAAAVTAALPGNRRPWFILQQVTDATESNGQGQPLTGEGPALAQMRYLRDNPHGNVVEVPPTVGEQYEGPALNIHVTERQYVINGELAALALRSVDADGSQAFGAWPVDDAGGLAGAVASYTLSAAGPLMLDKSRIGTAFRTGATIADAVLTPVGMDGMRWLYRVDIIFDAAPIGLTAILHGQSADVTPPGYGVSALRAVTPANMRFATREWHEARFGDYGSYDPGIGNTEPIFEPVLEWVRLHKILFS